MIKIFMKYLYIVTSVGFICNKKDAASIVKTFQIGY